MRLVPDWRRVLLRAWSVRLLLLAGLLSGLEAALPIIGGYLPISPGVLASVTVLVVAGAFVARIVAQPKSLGD
ncbi:DUF7940 domain-containing protein [Ancylobacter amanitiformis]|uniref:Uncharacterized protein n=1 Tax=Ancylobacter amanitiformis TaxID=217069 RepID=A0ABU0LQ92_9HYPH|nr:hypothetical protein [Ancylobacter amanitiformis]MDQ0510864.1 hypothetical protein [Ancylobacter amanitiformis]